MSDNYSFMFKTILAGDSEVGKSCINQRQTANTFKTEYQATIGVDFGSKIVSVGGRQIKLQIWDLAGQESFKSIIRSYYRLTIGAILVYSIDKRSSFNHISSWFEDIRQKSNDKLTFFLIGNKSDLENKREVSYDEGLNFAKQNGLLFMECSAKSGQNIESVFLELSEVILRKIDKGQIDPTNQQMGIKQGTYK